MATVRARGYDQAVSEYGQRRQRLIDAIEGGVAIIASAPTAIRNNDVHHPYRQDSDFYYLTGFCEPDSILVLDARASSQQTILFVRARDPDRELWDGKRAGVDGAVQDYGANVAYPIEEFRARIAEVLGGTPSVYYRVGDNPAIDETVLGVLGDLRRGARRGVKAPAAIIDPAEHIHEMRLRKSDAEITLMQRAADITTNAHRRAMAVCAPGRFEFEVEAELTHAFVAAGSRRPAYEPIVGSGANATVLHYIDNDAQMNDGDLLLIDAGCEFGHYASDVTRTFPVNGTFSDPQRALYEVVLGAQLDAIAAVKPDATIDSVHQTAVRALTKGLVALGLLQGDVSKLVQDEAYKPFYMHRTSHWLGMDVHDVGAYTVDDEPRPLQPGFVLTVEPGLYIAPDADVDSKWRGIGIRIEDDIVVTDDGHQNLTEAAPKTVADVEAACRG